MIEALTDPAVTALLPLFALLFLASFFFSGTETALFSLQAMDRQRVIDDAPTGRRLGRLLHDRVALISSILIGNESVNVSISALGAFLIAQVAPGRPWLNIVLLTPMLLLFSEITPKVIAFRFNAQWARLTTWPLSVFLFLVAPARSVLAGLVKLLARPFGVVDARMVDTLAESDLMTLLEQGEARGDVDQREREIIEAVFEFDDTSVGRLMTPLPDVFSVPVDIPWPELLRLCREAGHSRVPVYEKRVDNVIGVLLLKDLLKYRSRPPAGPRQLRAMLLKPVFVPRSKPADTMLREFLERHYHMSFVVNEHGTLVGLITLDDLLSELVGELLDPEDDDTRPEVESPSPGVLDVQGMMELEDFEEETGIALPEGEYRTVGGFVFHQLGRLPETGDVITWGDLRLEVVEMEGRRIAAVRVERQDNEESTVETEEEDA